uniref:Uncharacterized protein n=1 Tax=Setaria viridis TaxID=4556 RepID=A0A4U6UA53_SETVI|nr:hypothetical protein SEVIR_5G010175v2 [Setaria viridis]
MTYADHRPLVMVSVPLGFTLATPTSSSRHGVISAPKGIF